MGYGDRWMDGTGGLGGRREISEFGMLHFGHYIVTVITIHY